MIIFGGRSGEHGISLASARAIIDALQENPRYDVQPVGITRNGSWISSGDPVRELESRTREAAFAGRREGFSASGAPAQEQTPLMPSADLLGAADVVFPVLHGPYGEDGTMQGLLELAGVPYVGSGVLASAVSMDKVTMKKIFAYHGLPQVGWLDLSRKRWEEDPEGCIGETEGALAYPCYVKPSNLGSSVGINQAENRGELRAALDAAAALDRRIIVEEGIDAREVEVSVLGNEGPEASVLGEILVKKGAFYDYEAKYTEGGMELRAPADLPDAVAEEIKHVAREAYKAVDAAGMARIDFFLERGTGRLLLNEINTIPGFTPTSVYARLWAASGLPYGKLLDRLIDLALERHHGAL